VTGAVGEVDVADENVEWLGVEDIGCGAHGVGGGDGEAVGDQIAAQGLECVGVIFDQ
jgi:hypothetical protein